MKDPEKIRGAECLDCPLFNKAADEGENRIDFSWLLTVEMFFFGVLFGGAIAWGVLMTIIQRG